MSKDYTLPETRKYPIVFDDAMQQADYEYIRDLGESHYDAVHAVCNHYNPTYTKPAWIEQPKDSNFYAERFNY